MASMVEKSSKRKRWPLARWRVWVQASFLVVWLNPLVAWLDPGKLSLGFCSPVFHCYSCPWAALGCPIGILGQYAGLHIWPWLAIGTLLLTGSLLGSIVCGWACPFGFLQDVVAKIPTPKLRLPGWLGMTRYLVLGGLVFLVPYYWGVENQWFICRLCPAGALEAAVPYSVHQSLIEHRVIWPSSTKTIILIVFLVAMLFARRPWCTLFCPLGAIFGVLNHVSLLFLRFEPARCHDCDLCRDLCKYHGTAERRGSDLRCIRCFECTKCRALSITTVFQRQEPPAAANELPIIERS